MKGMRALCAHRLADLVGTICVVAALCGLCEMDNGRAVPSGFKRGIKFMDRLAVSSYWRIFRAK